MYFVPSDAVSQCRDFMSGIQKELCYLLLGFLLLFSIAKTVIPMQLPWDKYGYDCLWFVVLYLTGAYLRRYEMPFGSRRWRAAALYLGSAAAVLALFSYFGWFI